MSKLLVTGGAGFIGTNFVRYWFKKYPKDHIINLDKLTYAGHRENLLDLEGSSHYTFIKGDITDRKVVDSIVKNVDVVVHFAAESHVDRSIEDPMVFAKTNVVGTSVLLDSCLRHGRKRFHHISTDEVFGELKINDPPFSEKTAADPKSPYSASKAGSDFMVRSYYTAYGLPITITNCGNNYGPYQDPEKLIPRFITKLINNKKVPLANKGKNIRSWLSVEDHVRAIDVVLKKGEMGETYCIGGEEKSNLEVTLSLLKIFKKDEFWIRDTGNRAVNDFRYAINDSKIKRLGWKPIHKFDYWLKQTVYWYKDNKWWWKPMLKARRSSLIKQVVIDIKNSFIHNL
ncbi:dTDP-glucose 4,6-dehydratase [Patescibacteria group bacterium]